MNRPSSKEGRDAGFTLVELLVAMSLFGLLTAMIASTTMSSSKAVDSVRQLNDVNEEARLSLIRMGRELREAVRLDGVQLYMTEPFAGANYVSRGFAQGLTFSSDFNGNGTIEPNAVDPEVLTYRFLPNAGGAGDGQIQLSADDGTGTETTRPILSANVTDFHVELRSGEYACDRNGDGITTWQELDTNPNTGSVQCPNPDNNGVLGTNELKRINSLYIAFTVFKGRHQQSYSTQVNLRNVGAR